MKAIKRKDMSFGKPSFVAKYSHKNEDYQNNERAFITQLKVALKINKNK